MHARLTARDICDKCSNLAGYCKQEHRTWTGSHPRAHSGIFCRPRDSRRPAASFAFLFQVHLSPSTGSSRVFTSPTLNPGKEYHYTLKAEVVRDGKPVKVEKVVAVKAGELTPVALTLPTASVAQR